jgi:hypothetical protein
VDMDADIQRHFSSLCLTQSTAYFKVWRRRSPGTLDFKCIDSAPGTGLKN